MFPKIFSAFGASAPPAQQPAVTLPEGHRTQLFFNDSPTALLLLTRLSPALVRDFYGKARGTSDELQKDFTNMPRPVTAAAMHLVMDLLQTLQQPPQKPVTVPHPPLDQTTTGTLFVPSNPPFVPLQSRELYAGVPTARLIDAAFLASRLELEAPFEGLAAEIGRRVHKLVTFGGIRWSTNVKQYIEKAFPDSESVLHAVCRPDVPVKSTAGLLAEIAAGLRNEVGLPDRTSGAAAAERFADLAVLFNMRDAGAMSVRHDDKAALRRLLRRRWQPDEEAQYCKACKVTFRMVAGVLRSHCRRCGDVYCKSCVEAYTTSKAFATLEKPDGGDSGDAPRKICRTCHEVVGDGTVARFYMELIEGMGLSILDVRALMLLDDTWEAATVEVLWQYRNHMYMMRPSVAHDAIVLSSIGVASGHPEFLLRILEVEALWLLPEDHPTVRQMLATATNTFARQSPNAMLAGCGQLYCTRACSNARTDIGTFAVRVLRAIAHRENTPHAAKVRTLALKAIYDTLRSAAPSNPDAWLHALLDMYFSVTTCQSARGRGVVPLSETEATADRTKLETRLRTLLDAIVYIAVRSDVMRMKVVCEIAYRQSTKDTAVKGWCSILEASMTIARTNYEMTQRIRHPGGVVKPSCFSDTNGIGTFQTVLMTLVRCAKEAQFETEQEVREKLYSCFPGEYRGKTANDTIWFPQPAPYFFNPRKHMHGIVLRDVKLHSSNTRPAGIVFLVSATPDCIADRDEAKCERARVILKRDRLRQDQICCEVAALLPQLMQSDKPAHKILSYHVLPLTEECGIVEMLENAPNLQTLTKDEGKTLAEYLSTQIAGSEDTRRLFFLNSVRYLIFLGLVLGLGDRHRSNMVLDRSQLQLCHIDFGRVLGDRTVFEKADRLLNFCRNGTWDPKDIVVRFDDELAAAVQAMGADPEAFIRETVKLVVKHIRPNVELLYMVMSRLLEETRQQQRANPILASFGGSAAESEKRPRAAHYPADSSHIGLLSYQRAAAPLYDRAGQPITEPKEDDATVPPARALRERSHGYTDPVYQYLHQCLRTSQKDDAVERELRGLLHPRNRPIQDGSHWVNQAALSEGGWLNYGWGHVSAVSTAAATSATEVASSWFGSVTDRATVLLSAAGSATGVAPAQE